MEERWMWTDIDSFSKRLETEGLPLERDTIQNAFRLIHLIPSWMPHPEVGVDPDGQIYLEWQSSERWVLSLSVSPENRVYYAALFGNDSRHGSVELGDTLPEDINANLARFMEERQ